MTEKVISWEADFGIVVNPIRHPDLIISKICTDEVTIFHTKNAKDKLIFDQNLSQPQHILKKIGKKLNFDSILSSAYLEVVAKLTSLGLGYGFMPTRVASKYSLIKKLKDAPIFKDEICLVCRPEKYNNHISKKIIKMIRAANY